MSRQAPPQLVLLSTAHCTLCDQALDALLAMPELAGAALRVQDIAGDDALVARYGERLPVLWVGEQELDWPFGRDAVAAALARA